MSAFLQIRDAVGAALLASPALGGEDIPVFLGRYRPVPAEVDRAVNVRLVRTVGTVGGIDSGPNDWQTYLQVEFHARSTDDPEAAVDAMLAAGFEAMAEVELAGLGPMDVLSQPEVEWESRESDAGHICAILTARVLHRTQGTNLNPWS
jgi:hypothetical protein